MVLFTVKILRVAGVFSTAALSRVHYSSSVLSARGGRFLALIQWVLCTVWEKCGPSFRFVSEVHRSKTGALTIASPQSVGQKSSGIIS